MAYVIGHYSSPEYAEAQLFSVELSRVGFKDVPYYQRVFDLDKSMNYMLGIDQSPSCTGIALISEDFRTFLVFTIPIDDKSASKFERYVPQLEEFLYQLLEGINLRFAGYEAVPPLKYRNQKILLEMMGMIKNSLSKLQSVQCLDPSCLIGIHPQTWKSFVYDKSDKSVGRVGAFNNKSEIAKDIVKKLPILRNYYDTLCNSKGHDFDGFDAIGIVCGIRAQYFTMDWDLINKQPMYQLGRICVIFRYVTPEQTTRESLEGPNPEKSLLWGLSPFFSLDMVDTREWNSRYGIYQNYVMGANTNKIVLLECTDLRHLFAVLIESGVAYDENRTLICLIFKKTLVTDSVFQALALGSILVKEYY